MIREPYNVVPYNITIDTSQQNTFSLNFNGDELESYSYTIYENNQADKDILKSEIIDNPTIFNDDVLSFIPNPQDLTKYLGKNLLWRITLWENNASYKATEYKNISKSSIESAPNLIYLQDEKNLLTEDFLNKKEYIVNIVIRGERRRIIKYDSSTKSATVSAPFSFLPSGSVNVDKYILYTNFLKNEEPIEENLATIPVLNGITTDPKIFEDEALSNAIFTGVIPNLTGIKDSDLQNNYVIILDFGEKKYRVKEYWQWEVIYDIEKTEIVEDVQHYKVTITKTTNHEGKTSQTIKTLEDVTDISWYKEHDGDIGAYCIVDKTGTIETNTSFSVFKNYYESNFYFFKSRQDSVVSIDNFPTEVANAFPSRFYNFIGSYQQKNNIPIKYHYWEVYDISKEESIFKSEKYFNSNLSFSYDRFENNHSYYILLTVVNQDGVTSIAKTPTLIVKYEDIDFKTTGKATYDKKTYSVDVSWPDSRFSIPTLVKGEDGSFNYFFDSSKQEKLNLYLPLGTEYRYDNISGNDFILDSNNFMLTTFIGIEDLSRPSPWNGEILNLKSSEDYSISLVKNKYELFIQIKNKNNIVNYPFVKATKNEENNFTKTSEKFSLLLNQEGQQKSQTNQPLSAEEKNGFWYSWLEENQEIPIIWKDDFYWTETTSNTNVIVYKFLLYPNRAELYPIFRWNSQIISADNTKINIGKNNLLAKRINKTLLQIGEETREIIDYDVNTGIATIDSSFDYAVKPDDPYLCYYETGENKETNQLFVCEFSQPTIKAFNSISIFGNVNYDYLIVFNKNIFSQDEISEILKYYYQLKWTSENQNDIFLNCLFNGDLNSTYYSGIESKINGYKIYRNSYYSDLDIDYFDSILIAEINQEEIQKITNSGFLTIKDYSIRNRGYFNYSILPISDTIIGTRIETNKIKTDWYEWIFTSLGRIRDNIYRPIEQWIFKLNIENSTITHNTNKIIHKGMGKYPKYSIGKTNYITTSLTCLISDFNYQTIFKENYLIPVISNKISKNTSSLNAAKIFIQPTHIFDNINLFQNKAYLYINNQQRRITSYESNNEGTYVILEEPFKYFLPELNNDKTNNYIIYTDYLPTGIDESIITEKRTIYFDDSIERINAWNDFINSEEPLLIKDMKGNVYIGIISNNTEQSNIKIDDFPTTISFDITQIADINSYLIFDI